MRQAKYSTAPPSQEHGFVLVMTLWVLVIVAMSVGYFAERVAGAVELAQQSRQNASTLLNISGTRAELLYRLGTTSLTVYGLGNTNTAIRLDNRPYRGLGDSVLRIQDNRGLINLNFVEDARLMPLLGILGIPAEQRGRMIDTLRDYTDADNLRRLNGAEAPEYLALNLPPPTNTNLVTPWEAQRIIGWRDAPQLWQNDRLVELCSTSIAMGINPNTAPAEVLATVPGITAEIAQLIIAQRKLLPITDGSQLAQIVGLSAQQFADDIGVIPSNSVRITQAALGAAWAIQYNITLTPNGTDGPWRTDYYSRVRSGQPIDAKTNAPTLPPRSTEPLQQVLF